jgi:pimeloyl-ACP methyl ester carboxylesterase
MKALWVVTSGMLALGLLAMTSGAATDGLVTYRVTPRETDPAISRFNEPHYIVFDSARAKSADLLVFMTGTGGNPGNVSDFLLIGAAQGYRVIALAYNDVPAVVALCPQEQDPGCSAKVREKRIFGSDVTRLIDDTPAESIVNRLVKLLARLDHDHPLEAWGQYLDGDAPRWDRIAVAGHSQGAGMAAYIAQRKRVARVLLFSSPWDYFGRVRQLAPWVEAGPGATPSERWFAAYHEKENTADLIARAYNALRIPQSHVRVFTLEPARSGGPNPYHVSMVANGATPRDAHGGPAYGDEWRFLLGTPVDAAHQPFQR